jgi:hypothetical protein
MLRLAIASLEWRKVDDEIVVLNTRTARYLALNAAGGILWARLLDGADRPALTAELGQRYGLEPARAEADVAAFLAQLEEYELLEPTEVPTS